MLIKTRNKIALASLAFRLVKTIRSLQGKGTKGVFTRRGICWDLDLYEGIDFSIFLRGSFEPDLRSFFEKHLGPDEVILDVGANIGAHTLEYAKRVSRGKGKVVAIEATAYAFEKMQRNLALNPKFAQAVLPVHGMLVAPGQQLESTTVFSSWPLVGSEDRHVQHLGVGKSLGDARIATLDEVVSELEIPNIHWIKIDVDGHELQVLRGALDILNKHHPQIVMELAPDCDEGGSREGFFEMVSFMLDAGYQFCSLSGKTLPRNPVEIASIIPIGASMNVHLRKSEPITH